MNKIVDVVVVGGGISGCAIAYELAKTGDVRVALIERGEIASATTGESGGYIRRFNTDARLGALASESFDYYQNFSAEVDGGNCEFRKTGLVSRIKEADLLGLQAQIELLRAAGHDIFVSGSAPTNSLREANYGNNGHYFVYEPGLGNIDTRAACQSWTRAASKKGALILENTSVSKIQHKSAAIRGIETRNGLIETRNVIISAGAWSQSLLTPLPISLPALSARSFQYNIYEGAARYLDTAFMDNIEGFYTAPFRNGDLFAGTLGQDQLVIGNKFNHANDLASSDNLHKVMAKHFAFLKGVARKQIKRSYDAYSEDGRGIVTGFPEMDGLLLASGWSSGGIKSAPAIARQVAKIVASSARGVNYANT